MYWVVVTYVEKRPPYHLGVTRMLRTFALPHLHTANRPLAAQPPQNAWCSTRSVFVGSAIADLPTLSLNAVRNGVPYGIRTFFSKRWAVASVRPTAFSPRSRVNDPVFVKYGVVHDCPAIGREHEVDPAVAGLKCARVAEVSL